MTGLTFGSLFSGIGGFDLGFERAGMDCKWQVEVEPNCQKLLEQRFPVAGMLDHKATAANRGSNANESEFIVAQPLTVKPYADNESQENRLIAAPLVSRQGKGGFTDPVNDNIIAFDWQAGSGKGDESFRGKSRSYIVRKGEYAQLRANARDAVAFQQNTRDEVRLINGDGGIAGALAAEPGMKQQNYINAMGVRRLTPTECERLQGFPDGWTEGFSDAVRYRMLGNAVCVSVAEWLGRRIAAVEGKE